MPRTHKPSDWQRSTDELGASAVDSLVLTGAAAEQCIALAELADDDVGRAFIGSLNQVIVQFARDLHDDRSPTVRQVEAALTQIENAALALRASFGGLDSVSRSRLEQAACVTPYDPVEEPHREPAPDEVAQIFNWLGPHRLADTAWAAAHLPDWCAKAKSELRDVARGRPKRNALDDATLKLALIWFRTTGRSPSLSHKSCEGHVRPSGDFFHLVTRALTPALEKAGRKISLESAVRRAVDGFERKWGASPQLSPRAGQSEEK